MSSILSDLVPSKEPVGEGGDGEDDDDDDGSLQYVPAELRDLVAEATATLDEAQQSFLSSVQETDDEEQEDEATATAASAAAAGDEGILVASGLPPSS
jgi:hypothetical protein